MRDSAEGEEPVTSPQEVEMRRRLLMLALGLKPGHLRETLGLHSVIVSNMLKGERKLSPAELRGFRALVKRRVDQLFG